MERHFLPCPTTSLKTNLSLTRRPPPPEAAALRANEPESAFRIRRFLPRGRPANPRRAHKLALAHYRRLTARRARGPDVLRLVCRSLIRSSYYSRVLRISIRKDTLPR